MELAEHVLGSTIMRLFKEKAQVISERPIWVFTESAYLYCNESLIKLAIEVLTEWRNDKHLVG